MTKPLKIGCLTIVLLFLLGTVWFIGFGIGAFVGSAGGASQPQLRKTIIDGSGEAEIGFLNLNGLIVSSPEASPLAIAQGIITPQSVSATLRLALQDESIKALIIQINSPGGSAVASDQIYQYIQNAKAHLPVVILLGDTAASGGYFIASAGSHIVANPATLTGSIGVIAKITDVPELFNKIGIDQETYKPGRFKDLFSGTRDRTQEEQQMIQELLDSTYELFLNRVAAGRNMEPAAVRGLAEGQIYSGQKALELGLIDQLGYRRDAFEKAKKLAGLTEAKLVSISSKSIFELLFSQIKTTNPLNTLLPYLLLNRSGVQYIYK